MLTGKLVTVAGFVPIGYATSAAGEYPLSLFAVVALALIISWIVAVLFAPLIGVTILPGMMKHTAEAEPGRIMRGFRRVLTGAMRAKWFTIGLTLAALAASIFGLRFVPQQFFPTSDRPELLVDLKLSDASSLYATEKVVTTFEQLLKGDPVFDHWTTYVGQGAVRFYLPLNFQLANDFFSNSVIVPKSHE